MFFVIAGVINILLALFHLTFWSDRDFNWQEELPRMNKANRGLIQSAVILFIPILQSFGVIRSCWQGIAVMTRRARRSS